MTPEQESPHTGMKARTDEHTRNEEHARNETNSRANNKSKPPPNSDEMPQSGHKVESEQMPEPEQRPEPGEPVELIGTAPPTAGERRSRATTLREARSWPTLVLTLFCLLVGLPVVMLLTPQQELTIVGQHIAVGAREPSLSLSGPAQLVQIGNTRLDISPVRIWGPLRPQVTLGPVTRNAAAAAALDPNSGGRTEADAVSTLAWGFARWYGWATVGLLAFTVAATAVAAYLRILATLRRHSRTGDRALTAADLWHRGAGQIRAMLTVAVVVTMLGWAVSGALAYSGTTRGLGNVTSLSQVVGTYYLAPFPEGPPVSGYAGAVIGDSRVSRLGGPLVVDPTPEDSACLRSTDSLAAEIGSQLGERVLNLACPGASIQAGLRGPQVQGGQELPAQVGLLKQVQGLRYVVVAIGPNDLSWTDLLRYCYAVADCQDLLTQGEYEYRLAAFDRAYGDLLHDLNDLPDNPQIIIMTSYDVFKPDANCADSRGPAQAAGLTPGNIALLAHRNAELNKVLTTGAEKYEFTVASPRLTTLCQASSDELGPDIQGIDDPYPFHPTGIGTVRLASSAVRVIKPSD
jgi:hypothetical protein